MEVNGPGPVSSSFPVSQVRPATEAQPATGSASIAPQDEIEISEAARMLDELNSSPELRAERLEHIKAAIDAGTYETPEKLEIALSRLLDELRADDQAG